MFAATDLALERRVAIKVLSPALAESADDVERFQREAKLAASLDHPNIIGILAVGDDPALAYFVMKYIQGRTLDEVLRSDGACTVTFTRQVIAAIGGALQHAHSRGVVHRDLKPANLMLDGEGRIVITDFGIARQVDATGLTMTGTILGTTSYMSPEQVLGRPAGPPADQYALGVVAYQLLSGQLPYQRTSLPEMMLAHAYDEIPRVRSVRGDVPRHIDDCIARMMAKEPTDRFATLAAAAEAFSATPADPEAEIRTVRLSLDGPGAPRPPVVDGQVGAPPSGVCEGTATPRDAAPVEALRSMSSVTRASRPRAMLEPEVASSRLPMLLVTVLLVLGVAAATIWFTPSLRAIVFPAESSGQPVGPDR